MSSFFGLGDLQVRLKHEQPLVLAGQKCRVYNQDGVFGVHVPNSSFLNLSSFQKVMGDCGCVVPSCCSGFMSNFPEIAIDFFCKVGIGTIYITLTKRQIFNNDFESVLKKLDFKLIHTRESTRESDTILNTYVRTEPKDSPRMLHCYLFSSPGKVVGNLLQETVNE